MSEEPKKQAVTWFEALNEQVEWSDPSTMLKWQADVFGFQLQPGQLSQEKFALSLRKMRMHLGSAHFKSPVELSWLDDELKSCCPRLITNSPLKSRLPAFRADIEEHDASNSEAAANALLEQLRLTLLMQFAEFIGGTVDSGAEIARPIDRCRGLYRDESKVPEAAAYPAEIEKRWRAEIELLQEFDVAADDVVRCEYFFPKTAKGRFCSDSCRFSTFQITKQLQEPNYLAAKQKRYRSNKKHLST
ncbi:MAG: hypothetical protein JST89_11085 [Cyanobacteria bacterium SZAS-4]|nr:hypothetical protein [Cyanobacteria bacterium SZAS-4]